MIDRAWNQRGPNLNEGETMSGRPDLESFEPGAIYRHLHTGEVVEFVGVASMPELDDEDVGVFRFVGAGGCLIATKRGFDQGETFRPIAEDREAGREPDEASTAEWRAFVERDES
jgi:hypothetical protein